MDDGSVFRRDDVVAATHTQNNSAVMLFILVGGRWFSAAAAGHKSMSIDCFRLPLKEGRKKEWVQSVVGCRSECPARPLLGVVGLEEGRGTQ